MAILPQQIAEAKAELEKVARLAQDLNNTITNIGTVGKTVTESIENAGKTVSASISTLNNNVISLQLEGQIIHLEGLIGDSKTGSGLFGEINDHFTDLMSS